MREKQIIKRIFILVTIVSFIFAIIPPSVNSYQPPSGVIMVLRGGIGAKALIQTYYEGECFEHRPLNYYLTIQGNGVINPGTATGIAPGYSRTWVRTHFAFGFGSVIIYCKTTDSQTGALNSERSKPGLMIGFIVLAI